MENIEGCPNQLRWDNICIVSFDHIVFEGFMMVSCEIKPYISGIYYKLIFFFFISDCFVEKNFLNIFFLCAHW